MRISFEVETQITTVDIRGREMKIDQGKFPPNALAAIFAYGLQRIHNDAAGKAGPKPGSPAWAKAYPDFDKDDKEGMEKAIKEWEAGTMAVAEEKRDALYAGDLRNTGSGQGRKVDPVRREMWVLAESILRAKGEWSSDAKKNGEAMRNVMAKHEDKLRAKAESIVAARESDLSELLD